MTAESGLKEFQYNRGIVYLMLANTILFAFCGLINLFWKPFIAVPWLAGSFIWGLTFLLIKKIPFFIRITTQNIIINKGPLRSPKIVPWEQVSIMQQDGKNKLRLVLQDYRRIKISLFCMNKTDRPELVQEIENSIQRRANQAIHSDGNSAALRPRR